MRFLAFEVSTPLGARQRLGVLQGNSSILDLNLACRCMLERQGLRARATAVADAILPPDLLQFLDTGGVAERALRETLEYVDTGHALHSSVELTRSSDKVRILAPFMPVSYREFGQFETHMTRHGTRTLPAIWYEMPVYWKGNPSSTIGPGDTIPWPRYTSRLDFELEIAAVIGKRGINIAPEDALDYVAGFTIFNDVSARDQQFREKEMGNGPSKGKDFANVLGPTLVTPDEVDCTRFEVEVRVNGECWAKSDTADMHFGWPELISYVSRDEWLVPGDVFTSGTVSGCCALEHLEYPEEGPLLNPGDLLELEVAGIGTLVNRIGAPAPD